jgi:hypothetical protein
MKDLTILTYSGHLVDLSKGPTLEQVDIVDIAHHLSLQCRFAGACNHFYSIAEHSVYVAKLANKLHCPYYLLHDAQETWYQDLTRPLKNVLELDGTYNNLLDNCDRVLYPALGYPYEFYENLKADIKAADLYVYSLERKMLFRDRQPLGLPADHPLYDAKFMMSPMEAEQAFLEMFATCKQ